MTDFTFDDLDMKDLHEIHSVMKKDKKNMQKHLGPVSALSQHC